VSLWSEIKQRRITQVVFAYLAGGWMVLAVISELVDREVLPAGLYQPALAAYVVGILGALVVGWYHGELGQQKPPRREIVLLSLVGVVGIGAANLVVRNAATQTELRDALAESGVNLRRIGVLYFDDMSADGSVQAVADGITEGLIGTLAQVRELEVTSRNGSRRVRGLDASPDSIARILDVGTLVDGTVDQVGDEIRISVRVLEGQSGVPLFRDSYTWPAAEVATVGSALAEEVGSALREQLGIEVRLRASQAGAPSSAAWLQVARAEQLMRSAAESLQQGDGEAVWEAYEAAEAELVGAQEIAPEWPEPLVLHSQIAYERHVFAGTSEALLETMAEAVEHANEALALEADNAAALEWRGTAQYRRWLAQAEDESTLDRVFEGAQADLERALRLDPSRASVSSTLSHLYYQTDNWAQAVLSARDAYDRDAFLSAIDGVLGRLYQASYDLGEYRQARDWCLEGHRRFPENYRFLQCQIYVMTMGGASPDVAEAWALYERMASLMPEGIQSELIRGITQTFVGGVIGRAGLPDSADVVMRRARVGPEVDDLGEQMSMEGAMRAVIGDTEGAVDALQRFMVQNPGHFPGEHWWWRSLTGDPDFERLRTLR
jgi:TolB-like protein/tetratricopeptide (TPR) repeat protein